ncbi:MAG: methionine ABC transporter substrate-binding protein [Elusimicrobiota bacterium]|jgi:D-methionine transport system substrate-binding protein|nr:methionine ABC transporter substrate-binding protein [Elusimicrobiota bacterium]
MKKILSVLTIAAFSIAGILFIGNQDVSAQAKKVVLKVAADAVPHAEILEFVKPKLAKEGIDLQIYVTSEWTLINTQTDEGYYDANYFQHLPFLEAASVGRKLDLVSVGAIHIEPIGLYSHKYKKLSDLPANPIIAIPNDPSNEYRALLLLQQEGFLTLKKGIKSYQATKNDIEKFLKPVQLKELDAGLIVRSGDQFDAYITNTNRILEFGIKDPVLARESVKNSPYANLIVVKTSRQNDPAIKALVKSLQSNDVKKFIEKKYNGAVVPAF